jgi:peptide/nickel transport system permease protein
MIWNRNAFVRSEEKKAAARAANRKSESYLSSVWRRFCRHRLALISFVILLILVGAALLAPWIAPYDPNAINPSFSAAPSAQHWMGTDAVGRDVFSRLLYATRVSLLVGVAAALASTCIGVVLGLLSGYFGGVIDMVVMRVTDMVMSFPYILLVLVAASVFRPGLWTIVCILAFVDWPGVARLVRGNVLSLRETNFVKSDLVAGMPKRHILLSEILPNTLAPVLVYATSVTALSILDEAALSFLGLGIQPPAASLGNMLNGASSLTVLTGKLWLWMPPGIVLILIVVAINFIGDALRDAVDPTTTN